MHPTSYDKPINVIIDYDWEGNRINIIPSVYGKDDFEEYVKTVFREANTLRKRLYIDKKNLMSHISKVQFPRGNSQGSNNNITYKDDYIKSVYEKKYYQFAGENSETSDKHSLMNAKKMLAKGENTEYVRKLTGWFKGVDGKFSK